MKALLIKINLFSLLTILSVCALAQTNLPPVYEIKTDTSNFTTVENTYWQMLPDKNGKWTINDVTKPPLTNKFYFRSNAQKNTDTVANTYWFRYRFKNLMRNEAKISIDAHFEVDNIYVIDSNKNIKHYLTGDYVEWNKKDGFKPQNNIPLLLQPGEEITIYEQGKNHVAGMPENFSLNISSTEKIQEGFVSYVDNGHNFFSITEMENAFLVGMLLIPFFLNLFFFRITKEKEYLYFSLFVIFLAVTRLLNSFGNYWYWRDRQLEPYLGYFNLCWVVIPFFLVQFIRYFFKTFIEYPRWDKFIIALSVLTGMVTLIFEVIDPSWSLNESKHIITPTAIFLNDILVSLGNFSIAITFLKYRKRKNKFMNLVIIGGMPLMIFWGVEILFEAFQRLGVINFDLSDSAYFIPEIICIIWFVLFFTLVLLKRFNQLRIENAQQALDKERLAREKEVEKSQLIEQQKIELEKTVEERTAELKQSLRELKSTQAQLIQSEKMASLGELTAGIAHEIQNPLNFVNNFSEVNKEMLEELKAECLKPNAKRDDDLQNDLINDVIANEEKINYHGKRADAIVKGMLQHSRASTGKKEPADINALADEYLRLSYHGTRVKDKSFNAEIKTDFDNSIGKINVVPQDIGRVLLNLFNNAFYAVNEKFTVNRSPITDNYKPTVSVQTKKVNDKIQIVVSDNGNGIPSNIIDKIFQPFFTTKPTGQGTGLGLSLAYDIITKEHNGTIKAESKEGEGSTFVIILPTA